MDPQSNQEPQQPMGTPPQSSLPPTQEPNVQQSSTPPPSPVTEPQPVQQPYTPPTPVIQPPTMSAPDMGAIPPQMQMPSPKPKKSKMWLIIILIVLVLAGAGVGAYFVFFRNNTTANQAASQSSNAAGSGATDLSSLSKVSVSIPGGLSGYSETATGYETIKDYVTTDGSCELMLGTSTAAELPGADLNAIVEPQIQELRNVGATVTGPTAGAALIVKDSANSNVSYSLPTINFDFSQGSRHVTAHYSAVILKGGDRVIINRICKNASGTVDQKLMTAVDETAKNIVITKQ